VRLYAGDAVYRPSVQEHPLDPSSNERFNLIRALDCAYHFNSRVAFLSQAYHSLEHGGQLILADICFESHALEHRWTSFLIFMAGLMPAVNVVSKERYLQDMNDLGFSSVTLEDISEDVFPGFVGFLKSRGSGWWVFGWLMKCYNKLGARFVIVRGTRK
jgi:SAM-dependent methyltransferase